MYGRLFTMALPIGRVRCYLRCLLRPIPCFPPPLPSESGTVRTEFIRHLSFCSLENPMKPTMQPIASLIAVDDTAQFRNDVQLSLFDDPVENLALLRSYIFTVAAPGG